MKMKLFLPLGLCLLAFTGTEFSLRKKIEVKATIQTTDNLGNFYLVNDEVLRKYDNTCELIKSFSSKLYGRIDRVDAANPMKIIVYYRNFSTVIFLDNTLSPIGDPVPLDAFGTRQSPVIASSFNTGFWIFNTDNFELIRLDGSLQKTHSTGNIAQLTALSSSPAYLTEYNSNVYLSDPANGILVFDIYGTYSRTIPLRNIMLFQVSGDNLTYVKNKMLMSYNMKTLNEDSILLPDTSAISARIEKDELFLLSKKDLSVYSVKQP